MKQSFVFALVFVQWFLYSQDIPPINMFTSQDYGAEDQNWSISQDEDGFIYVANNKGLLSYNGANWKLYKSPNDGILRSVNAIDNVIYTGGYMDFGYWERNSYNSLIYQSLVIKHDLNIEEDEEIWTIIQIEDYILFQSFERIYIYNKQTKSFNIIDSNDRINKMFKVDETIYFQKTDQGIFRIENGKESLVIANDKIFSNDIINITKDKDTLKLQTKENGVLLYSNNQISNWNIEADSILKNRSIYSSLKLEDGTYLLGTISNGIIHIDSSGRIIRKINQADGLGNNTVLALYEDVNNNVWLGLDNGINVVNISSAYSVYTDKLGALGTVYCSAKHNNSLYLGTNQGLFIKGINNNEAFNLVKGTKGQVWTLKIIGDELFCGHDNGTFIINGDQASLVSKIKGTWAIKAINDNPNLVIQGNYKGLFILENSGNQWSLRNKIDGFNISSRYFEFVKPNQILVNHEYKGVYHITVDKNYRSVLHSKKLGIEKGIKSSIVSYDDGIIYFSENGVFKLDDYKNELKQDAVLTNILLNNNYNSGKLIYESDKNRLWSFTNNNLIYIEPGQLSDKPKTTVIALPSELRETKAGYENILNLENERYLIGTTNGYFTLDLNRINTRPKEIFLSEVNYHDNANSNAPIPIDYSSPISLRNDNNNIDFSFAVPTFNKFSSTLYQYKLEGFQEQWSNWSTNAQASFKNLPHGNYLFSARAKTGNSPSNNMVTFNFQIEKPWYLKPIAIASYILLGFLIIACIHFANKRYYKKQRQKLIDKKERERELEQLANQQQIVQFKNQNLQLDIENKNRELGMATMNLVKRNELLNAIKDELTKSNVSSELKDVIKLINSNLNDTNDWKRFEEAFTNVDKDFMKRIKERHPSITSNDLRLCTYLRLNLSSKEIAPLLNISHKSVEVKRYRLRKKMELGHNQSLSDYILEL